MADATHTAGTVGHKGGFPPFDQTTFPGQIFWLAITFAVLFVVIWRIVVPRIGGTLADRKSRIAAELGKAEQDRRDAENAWATYQNTLVEARQRARIVIEDNRARVVAEAEKAEAVADTEAQDAIAKAQARLAALRAEAKGHILRAAQEAAVEIVARLTGETVGSDEAAAAVLATQGQ